MYKYSDVASIAAQLEMNDALIRDVKDGLREAGLTVNVITGALAGIWLERLTNAVRVAQPKEFASFQKDEARMAALEQVFEAYFKPGRYARIESVSKFPPMIPYFIDEKTRATVCARLTDVPSEIQLIDDAGDPVKKAWNVARTNKQRAMQRVNAVMYLADQLSRVGGTLREEIDAEYGKVTQDFFSQAQTFDTAELQFAVLLRGEALEITRATSLDTVTNPRYSIMQYLERDQISPGRYYSNDETAFRDKIAEYLGS